jgi:hypothetical protein
MVSLFDGVDWWSRRAGCYPKHYTFTLKMATALFAETLVNT